MRPIIFYRKKFLFLWLMLNKIAMMKKILLSFLLFVFGSPVIAQSLDLDLQIRPRLEHRNGYKTMLSGDQDPATFISQRSRVNLQFQEEKLRAKLSVQNIHVWGDLPTMRKEGNQINFFEAYGQYDFSNSLSLRLGRQVLSYDNQRILGEVNWAQQAQSHDAALLSFTPVKKDKFHIGFALNAQEESMEDLPYELNSYKDLQFAWYHLERAFGGLSFLLLNTGYEYTTPEGGREVDYLQTYGAYYSFRSGKLFGDLSGYGQTGKRSGNSVSAFYAAANFNWAIGESWKIGGGTEYLSGTDGDGSTSEIYSFTPLFGTNHGFNGHMDYFYVGNHLNSVGLVDMYGRFHLEKNNFQFAAVPHVFMAAADLMGATGSEDAYLGTEIDLSAGYTFDKALTVKMGYSQMFGSSSLEILKGGEADQTQNWAWVMVNFSPKIISYKKDN